jgi:D-mannonate dehydratase
MSSSLYQSLQTAKTEEDVKDAYIKALGLKGVSKNLIDIQTDEVWFEAKDRCSL